MTHLSIVRYSGIGHTKVVAERAEPRGQRFAAATVRWAKVS